MLAVAHFMNKYHQKQAEEDEIKDTEATIEEEDIEEGY